MRLKGKGTSQKKKRCVKSTAYPCGFACINIKDKCHNVLHGQAATYVLWLGKTEERLAKINAHRSARGKDRIGLVENKGLSKLPRERSPLVEGILSGKVEPIATTELGKAAKALFKKDQEIKQKLADMEARSKEALRKIERQSSKKDYAFTDNPETNKALDKALRGNDVALSRFIKRLKETDLDTAVSETVARATHPKVKEAIEEYEATIRRLTPPSVEEVQKRIAKNDYAFSDNTEANKDIEKALKGNDIAISRFLKRVKETDFDTATDELILDLTDKQISALKEEGRQAREIGEELTKLVRRGQLFGAELRAKSDGKLSRLSDYRKPEKGNPDLVPKPPVKSKPDNVTAISGQGNVEDISNARFQSKLKKGDLVGAIDDAIRTSNEASKIAKKGIADLERSQSEMEQKFDEVRAKYRLLGEPDPEADAAQARIDARKKAKEDELKAKVVPIGKKEKPPSAKSKPTREQLIAEENRLGKELDVILNKYPGRRTPEQQREIDAKQAEYRAANRAIRGFNGGKSTDFSEQRSLYRNYRN